MVIIDASVVLAWLIPEPRSEAADKVVLMAKQAGATAPSLLALEVANALRTKLRRGEISLAERDAAIALFERLHVAKDTESIEPDVLRETVRLSDLHGLTAYDAAYLEAALRYQAPLASLDDDLRRAARAEGLDVHPA